VDAATAAAAAGQRDVERLLREARGEPGAGERDAALLERGLDALLGCVIGCARRFSFFDGK
jgi:hypothetical protein